MTARLCTAWFLLLAVAVGLWWVVMFISHDVRAWFLVPDSSVRAFWAFLLPDGLLLFVGSLAAADCIKRSSPYAVHAVCVVCGGVTYATLYCLAITMQTGTGWPSTLLMSPAAVGCIVAACSVRAGTAAHGLDAHPSHAP